MTFWTLSMYDLYVPTAAYEKQITLLQQQISHIEDNKDMVCGTLLIVWEHYLIVMLTVKIELKLIIIVSIYLNVKETKTSNDSNV